MEILDLVEASSGALTAIDRPVSAIVQKMADKYKRVDDFLANTLINNGIITSKDEELAARLLLIPKAHRRIRNLSKILQKADSLHVAASPDHTESVEAPSDDWMDFFIEKASIVHDEEVQDIWAAILAGECAQTGSFKKVMLDRLALLDKEMAMAFAALCRLSFTIQLENGDSYLIPMYLRDDELAELVQSEINLNEVSVREYQAARPKEHILRMLQEVGFISLSEPFDEREIFEPVAFTYKVLLGGTSIYQSHSFYEEGSEWHNFIPTGSAQFTFIGKSLCLSLARNHNSHFSLPSILIAYFSFQDSLRTPSLHSESTVIS